MGRGPGVPAVPAPDQHHSTEDREHGQQAAGGTGRHRRYGERPLQAPPFHQHRPRHGNYALGDGYHHSQAFVRAQAGLHEMRDPRCDTGLLAGTGGA